MPRTRWRQKTKRDDWTDGHLDDLLTGPTGWLCRGWPNPWGLHSIEGGRTQAILDDMRRAWEQLKSELLPAWIAEHPGTRPWAWWQFDSPEPRRLIRGPGASVLRDPTAPPWAKRLAWGKPVMFTSPQELKKSVWESEPAYISRLGLLTDADSPA